ncbi:MAG: HlyD family efflux transporter periplasmic adaptor subunit [Gammaproteobacteria bacterium]|nr:HlyD family efflux transporter periplasmic adaptor subunit [Gammaproteobacteria bacterium]MBU1970149.1 HlyD family efflux transporter periplasmic adaptor subunit [Gammaproteobacteria bacterium]
MAAATKPARKTRLVDVDPLDFSPGLLRIQAQPPTPFARTLLYILLTLLALLLIWALFGKLDVVASASGKLIPQSYLKIVQPSEQGVIRDILVEEGQHVQAGQLLMRMDTTLTEADGKTLASDAEGKRLALRRIDAELSGRPFTRQKGDPAELYNQTRAQYQANITAYETALAQERSLQDKARSDLAAAETIRSKLLQTLPHYRQQEEAYDKLVKEGFASKIMGNDKVRERIEKEQDLKSQEYLIQSAQASLDQSARRLAQISADYQRQLRIERADIEDKLDKATGELTKQQYRRDLHELRAPQECGEVSTQQNEVAGAENERRPSTGGCIVKDLATHTIGTVISPGTIIMTLVPEGEILRAEVWVGNEDVGFIHTGEPVKIKFAAYQFQKYGMVEGRLAHLSADASDNNPQQPQGNSPTGSNLPFAYRALVDLKAQHLIADGVRHSLTPGMQVTAEIHLGTRSIFEYLLSPVMGAFQEAGRER